MWNGKTVSVVLMTYAERDSIRRVIEGFFDTGLRGRGARGRQQRRGRARARRWRTTAARLVQEPQAGLRARHPARAVGGHRRPVVLAEPDGTFLPEDLTKLLVYSDECDVVFGTRTTRELIWHGANMSWFLRWGNWAVAKMIEVLFNTSHLSDVGCTYRLLRARPRPSTWRPTDDGRRQPRRSRDHAAHDRLRARASWRCR